MKKELGVFLLPICMVACSQESNVGQVAADANDMADVEALVEVPVFAFGEDGSRYNINLENGEKTKIEMNRSKLVVSDENEFESLKEKYRQGSNDAKEMAYPVNYYCKAELLAINADYSEVVTSDGKVLLDDASLLEGCVDISKDEPLAKTTSYTNYSNSRTVNQPLEATNLIPKKIYVESDIVRNAGSWEGRAVTAVYAYSVVDGQGIYVPYAPKYAAMHGAIFRKARCYDDNGVFECKDFNDNVKEADCWYKLSSNMVSNCLLFDHEKKYGKNQNAKYYSWSIQFDYGTNLKSGSASDYGVITLHAVVLQRKNILNKNATDTFYIRTGKNIDQTFGDKFYNKYLSGVNLLAN